MGESHLRIEVGKGCYILLEKTANGLILSDRNPSGYCIKKVLLGYNRARLAEPLQKRLSDEEFREILHIKHAQSKGKVALVRSTNKGVVFLQGIVADGSKRSRKKISIHKENLPAINKFLCTIAPEESETIIDNIQGGIGLMEKAHDNFDELIEKVSKLLTDCRSKEREGYPYCLQIKLCDAYDTELNC